MLAAEFRLVAIDTPGFGEASSIPGYSVEEMADRFAKTITGLRLKRFVLVGHSMTGKVAAVMAASPLRGLEKLVLLTPSPLGPEPIAPEARERMLAQAQPTRADAEQYIRANSALPLPQEVFERAMEDRLRASPEAWRAWLERGSREDWTGRVPSIALPTLVIAAERDSSLGPEMQQRLTMPRLAAGQMKIVQGAGHLVPMEAPKRLAALLRAFAAD